MKHSYLIACLLLLPFIALSQKPSTTATVNVDEGLVSKQGFNSAFNENVTYALTGDKSLNTWGNFVSVNVVKPATTLAFANVSKYKGKVTFIESGSVTGGIDQDFVSIFSNNKLNSSVDLRGNIAWIIRSKVKYTPFTKFFYTGSSEVKLDTAVTRANRYYNYKDNEYNYTLEKLKKSIDSLAVINTSLIFTPAQNILFNRLKYTYLMLSTEGADKLDKSRIDSVQKLERKAEWSTIRITWIDVFLAGKQQKLNLYTGATSFTKQLVERNFFQYKYGAAANIYFSSTFKYYKLFNGIYRIEYNYSRGNNSAELDPYDVSTSSSVKSDTTNQTRQVSQKVSAYQRNAYIESYFRTIKFDVLKEIISNHRAYLHIAYEVSESSDKYTDYTGDKPLPLESIENLTLGFLVSFTNKDKPKSLLNVEPYIIFRDLSNAYNHTTTALQRSEIGIRTTFPFGLPTK